jgi:uncharacterized membrane protein
MEIQLYNYGFLPLSFREYTNFDEYIITKDYRIQGISLKRDSLKDNVIYILIDNFMLSSEIMIILLFNIVSSFNVK